MIPFFTNLLSGLIPLTYILGAIKNQMRNPDRETVSRLDALPNIGKAMAEGLQLIGIDHPKKLIGTKPFKLYEELCTRKCGCELFSPLRLKLSTKCRKKFSHSSESHIR